MFVVRLKRPDEDFDLKAFVSKRAALARFRTAQSMMIDGAVDDCALFEAQAPDAERAIELVNQGHATLIEANLEDPRTPLPVRATRPAAKAGRTRTTTRRRTR